MNNSQHKFTFPSQIYRPFRPRLLIMRKTTIPALSSIGKGVANTPTFSTSSKNAITWECNSGKRSWETGVRGSWWESRA